MGSIGQIVGGSLCLLPFVGLVALIVFVSRVHSSSKEIAEAGSDLKFESDLQHEISRSRGLQVAPTWSAPKLPSSVIASIWTHRFIGSPFQPPAGVQRYASALKGRTWDYGREAPYIIAAAFLSLRDAGLIRMFVEPRGLLDSFERVTVERTDLALDTDMPAVEGGLLQACLDLAQKRFFKTTQPSASAVVRQWMGRPQNHPYRWVLEVATHQGRELGLYEPVIGKRGWFGRPRDEKPVFSMEHLAACEDQVFACVARWREFGVSEPELQQRLITDVSFAIDRTRPSG